MNISNSWDISLKTKPDIEVCMERVYAWFEGEVLDRVPIRFHRHNAEYDVQHQSNHQNLKERWFDAEYQVDQYLLSTKGMHFNAETFPVYWPNLGPGIFAAFHGGDLRFEEVTSWNQDIVADLDDLSMIKFTRDNIYYKKMVELTEVALQKCAERFLVGYTSMVPGMDCAAAWRGTENLCFDLLVNPDHVKSLLKLSMMHFNEVFNDFDMLLKTHGQPSVSWMNIPVFGKGHIPSNDFSSMISREHFDEFGLPLLQEEVRSMTHNIFHVDGLGVAKHIESILSVPQIQAVQWAQGVGDDYPIMQHLDFIRYVQSKNKSIIVDLHKDDLDSFMAEMSPKGIFFWIAADNEEEEQGIMKRVKKWR